MIVSNLLIRLIYIILFGIFSTSTYADEWGPFRGATASVEISEKDVADFAKIRGNLLRIGFSRMPLMNKESPYEFNEKAFAKLDQILDWCKQYGIKVVIDPHTTPGTERNTSTRPNDELWRDFKYHDLLNNLWDRIARQYRNRNDVIVGYNLLNEPAAKLLPFPDGPADYNALVRRLVETVRKQDKITPIIIDPSVGRTVLGLGVNRMQGLTYLEPFPYPNIVYSPHMYEPGSFTHQGVKDFKIGIGYPGRIGFRYWDKETLREILAPAVEWQRSHRVPIYIGEFSASRYSGESGAQYLIDLIDLFEEYGWSWTYHAWREAPVWDAEIAGTGKNDRARSTDAPRLQLLKDAFARNRAP
ncbi:MAG: cellulase family glycosylhydrolase [Gammaproteobacteria bacterium]|nr:cellulase family glycosylhydrolase [Gammaproteobacteria bacterium]